MTKHPLVITTSWDDGHPSDRRLAERLLHHGLSGTFYVPRSFGDRTTIDPSEYVGLGDSIEVGAHTLRHVVLTDESRESARDEITASKAWIEDRTGRACPMFCPPCGKFNAGHLRDAEAAGYTAVRTVEGWSLDRPRPSRFGRLRVLPTSIQAFPNPTVGNLRNLAKRRALRGLGLWARFGRGRTWTHALDALLAHGLRRSGVLHLWGHSWELDEAELWGALESTLAKLGRVVAEGKALTMTNGQLAQSAATEHLARGNRAHAPVPAIPTPNGTAVPIAHTEGTRIPAENVWTAARSRTSLDGNSSSSSVRS
ncbi:MAG: polysaccharide deacetylase family protein [Planctomycetota bacterium]